MKKQSLLEKLTPDFDDPGKIALQNQETLRAVVGGLGMLLPFILMVFLRVTEHYNHILPSVSHYYYTRANTFFLIIVSLLAIFLIIYKGVGKIEFRISTLAGVAALLMLICPTGNLQGIENGKYDAVAITCFDGSAFRPKFHYGCAAVFLLCLAIMSMWIFTKPNKEKKIQGNNKPFRNIIYRVCAVIMFIALAIALMGFMGIIDEKFYDGHQLTFYMEFTAVEAFGFSWMVKGHVFFPDKK